MNDYFFFSAPQLKRGPLDGNRSPFVNQPDVDRLMLALLAQSGTDTRLGRGVHYLAEALRAAAPPSDPPRNHQIHEAIWSLIGRGLAYIDISQSAPENWSLQLTGVGIAAVRDEEINPDDPSGYLRRLYSDVPSLSSLVKLYIIEAVNSYYHKNYLAATVMLGVAAEAAFVELAGAFASWQHMPSEPLRKILADPKRTQYQRFEEFRKRLLPITNQLPEHLRGGLELQINSVLDLLRTNRNDAGHPTGIQAERDECFVSLRIFARVVKRIYELTHFFRT